jgi:hypothetical protein
MKKGLAILLIFCYALTASGATFSFHYCGGKLKHIGFTPDKDDKGCCGKKKKDKCCKDKLVKVVKKVHQHSVAKVSIHPPDFNNLFVLPLACIFTPGYNQQVLAAPVLLRPPPLITGNNPLYILYSVFRI